MICPICERNTPKDCIERHHVVPKSKGGKEVELVCCSCGDMIHQLIPNKDLERKYNSIDKLRAHPDIIKWAKWAKKRPNDFTICMKRKKRKG